MAREAPNPFGTSLIDLLVSGLAMVAMLWVMNAMNNGLLGTGDEEAASALVRLQQFGAAHHMKRVTVSQPGAWDCTFDLIWPGRAQPDRPAAARFNECIPATEHGAPEAEDGRIAFSSPDAPLGVRTTVSIELEAPGERFFTNLIVAVENLVGQDLEVAVAIEPCCSPIEPHYVGLWVYSGAGHREIESFWQTANQLEKALDLSRRFPERSFPNLEPWILQFGYAIEEGEADPLRTIFDVPIGMSCVDFQRKEPLPSLRLTFESEGDVRVELPEVEGTSAVFEDLQAQFDERLVTYVRWLDRVRP